MVVVKQSEFDTAFDKASAEYVPIILKEIRGNIVRKSGDDPEFGPSYRDINAAFEEYLSARIPSVREIQVPKKGIPEIFLDFISVHIFLIVAVFMTVVFGILGWSSIFPGARGASPSPVIAGFLDIAKIFAGAIVGNAAGAATSVVKSKRGGG